MFSLFSIPLQMQNNANANANTETNIEIDIRLEILQGSWKFNDILTILEIECQINLFRI